MNFLNLTSKAKIKSKKKKWSYNKLKSFAPSTNKMKGQSTEWDKILAYIPSNKGLISKIYKKCIQFNSQKKKKSIVYFKNGQQGNSLVVQWLELCALTVGDWVQSPIQELRSCKLRWGQNKEENMGKGT